MIKLKAYNVGEIDGDCAVIIFAESRNRAKSQGTLREECGCVDYIELSARRVPEVDGLADKPGIMSWDGNEKTYRDLRWIPHDTSGFCQSCGLYDFEGLPESYLNEDEICAECAQRGDS